MRWMVDEKKKIFDFLIFILIQRIPLLLSEDTTCVKYAKAADHHGSNMSKIIIIIIGQVVVDEDAAVFLILRQRHS